MDRAYLLCTALLASSAFAGAQNAASAPQTSLKLSDVAGTWEGKSMLGPNDSVFNTWGLKATASRKGWTTKRANGAVFPVRIIAVGGDSIVYEAGPYPSALRPGQTTTTRVIGHFDGDKMTGTWEAHYKSGDVARGKVEATRKK